MQRSDSGGSFLTSLGAPAAPERQRRELVRLARAAQGQPQAVIGVLEYWLGRESTEGPTRERD